MILNSLCAAKWTAYIPDIVVGIFAIIMIIVSARKGFVGCLLGIVSSLVALVLAITLSGKVADATGGLFGLQGLLADKIGASFAKTEGLNVDVSITGVEEALKTQNVSAILGRLVLKVAGKQDEIAAGTTLAMLMGQATGKLAVRLITGIVLFIVIKLVVFILKKIMKSIMENIEALGTIDRILGALFGCVYALAIACVILAVLAVFPVNAIGVYFSDTLFVKYLYLHNPLVLLLSHFI